MSTILTMIIDIFNDFNISYAEKPTENFNQIYVEDWDTVPDVSYNKHSIRLITMQESFSEYKDLFTPALQQRLNESFAILGFRYSAALQTTTIELTINYSKEA